MSSYKIIPYDSQYEKSWLRCRVLSFLDSAYYVLFVLMFCSYQFELKTLCGDNRPLIFTTVTYKPKAKFSRLILISCLLSKAWLTTSCPILLYKTTSLM